MERLGIAINDKAGMYAAAALIRRRRDLSFTILYDPATGDDFFKKNKARFRSMKMDAALYLSQDADGDFVDLFKKAPAEGRTMGYRNHDVNTEFLAHTVADGLFHHSYVLNMIDAYGARLEKGGAVVLALLGYSYRRDDFIRAFKEKEIAVVDPLDLWLDAFCETEEAGECRFFWTVWDFSVERFMSELLGEAVHFRKYYPHPWLRGEVSKKR